MTLIVQLLLRACFEESPEVWAFDHLLLLDCICGTTCLSAYVILNLLS